MTITINMLENIPPGVTYVYCDGFLPLGSIEEKNLGEKAMEMYERGLAVLTCLNKKPGEHKGHFEYYITGVKPGTIRRFTPQQKVIEKREYVSSVRGFNK